jgi:ABC-type nitrate/sulfonate/bicarbonate transport system ATPase subunit
MAPLTTALAIRITRKQYPVQNGSRPLQVFEDFELTVDSGSFLVITGPSGCGKTTLLNIVAGLDRDFEGRVSHGAAAPRLAYAFQTPRLLPWRTVRDNVALALPARDPGVSRVDDLLDRVGLARVAAEYPERLSLGMQRRVALARAFVIEPDILLMDEPFVSLDEPTAWDLRGLLLDLWSRRRATVLFVTHDRTEAVALATRLVLLSNTPARVVRDVAVSISNRRRTNFETIAAEERRLFPDA